MIDKIQEETTLQSKNNEDLLVLLKRAQSKFDCVPEEVITEIAKSLNISISEVYGVATFYSFLSKKPLGRNVIRICKSLPCSLKNYQMIIKSVEDELGIKTGETTPDGKFSLELTNCIGTCDKAPAMLINNDVHGHLTPKKISQILKTYK
ncbi:NADH-quinone oxidoreductase subunit NuoE [Chloroflexota bacterium]